MTQTTCSTVGNIIKTIFQQTKKTNLMRSQILPGVVQKKLWTNVRE